MTQVAVPTGEAALRFLGWPTEDTELVAQADQHAANAVRAAAAYTRKVGFTVQTASVDGWTCEPDLAAAIVSAAARSLNNPTASVRLEAGNWSEVPGNFLSWSLTEHLILRGYRRTTG